MMSYVKSWGANIAKPHSTTLFFAEEMSLLQMKCLALATAIQATKVLLMEMTCFPRATLSFTNQAFM